MSSLIGFFCRKCSLPFFIMIDTPQNILDGAKEIKKYQKRGFDFEEIDSKYLKENKLCSCGLKNKNS